MEEKSTRKYSIVGFPDELGVKNVNGRLGTAHGPQAFIEVFSHLHGKRAILDHCQETCMVRMGMDLEQNHVQAAREVARLLKGGPDTASQNQTLIAIGGGHDYGYSWIKGLVDAERAKGPKKAAKIGCINIDAHFDLRPYSPVMTSGSPFRRLIEENLLDPRHLIEFGIQKHCNRPELWAYAARMKIKTVPFETVRAAGVGGAGKAVIEFKKSLAHLKKTCGKIVISLDLDALSFSFAAGVSAPQAEGFTASEIFEMLEIAGSDKKVTSLGIFELAPALDFQNYTARLAAQGAWHFLDKKLN